MRFPVSLAVLAAVAALCVCGSSRCFAQAASSQSSSQSPSSVQNNTPQPSPSYIVIDPLANVRYDNRYDLSLGMAYAHIKAGPNLLQGANLGGLNLSGSYWMSRHWALEGTGRGYVGTSGAAPNTFLNAKGQADSIQGPFVAQYVFAGGPEWLGPHNKHGALIAHVLAGGAYGQFQKDLRGQPTSLVGFYYDQLAPVVVMGGHIDLNRSAQWAFRISPDAILTDYAVNWGRRSRQMDINTAISVGVEYRFKKKR
ncbi:hypothetical protein DYQ86_07900 [Acidobacteria bacterium AB60]|nr:hypothetical protein DYQ86_07900 [Acidobacteria bacterium AB60]